MLGVNRSRMLTIALVACIAVAAVNVLPVVSAPVVGLPTTVAAAHPNVTFLNIASVDYHCRNMHPDQNFDDCMSDHLAAMPMNTATYGPDQVRQMCQESVPDCQR